MDCKVYAFYRSSDAYVVLDTGERIRFKHWPGRVAQIHSDGDDVMELDPRNPEEMEYIKHLFPTVSAI